MLQNMFMIKFIFLNTSTLRLGSQYEQLYQYNIGMKQIICKQSPTGRKIIHLPSNSQGAKAWSSAVWILIALSPASSLAGLNSQPCLLYLLIQNRNNSPPCFCRALVSDLTLQINGPFKKYISESLAPRERLSTSHLGLFTSYQTDKRGSPSSHSNITI